MNKKLYYLAYGSNLNITQMKYRCPTAKVIGTATIKNYELLFKGSKTGSYLTIERKVGSHVPVAVWEVTAPDVASLDRYEGYPHFYYKAEIKGISVRVLGKKKPAELDAFVYIMHEDRPLGVPSSQYVRTCLAGYRAFGFDTKFLAEALSQSEGGDSK